MFVKDLYKAVGNYLRWPAFDHVAFYKCYKLPVFKQGYGWG